MSDNSRSTTARGSETNPDLPGVTSDASQGSGGIRTRSTRRTRAEAGVDESNSETSRATQVARREVDSTPANGTSSTDTGANPNPETANPTQAQEIATNAPDTPQPGAEVNTGDELAALLAQARNTELQIRAIRQRQTDQRAAETATNDTDAANATTATPTATEATVTAREPIASLANIVVPTVHRSNGDKIVVQRRMTEAPRLININASVMARFAIDYEEYLDKLAPDEIPTTWRSCIRTENPPRTIEFLRQALLLRDDTTVDNGRDFVKKLREFSGCSTRVVEHKAKLRTFYTKARSQREMVDYLARFTEQLCLVDKQSWPKLSELVTLWLQGIDNPLIVGLFNRHPCKDIDSFISWICGNGACNWKQSIRDAEDFEVLRTAGNEWRMKHDRRKDRTLSVSATTSAAEVSRKAQRSSRQEHRNSHFEPRATVSRKDEKPTDSDRPCHRCKDIPDLQKSAVKHSFSVCGLNPANPAALARFKHLHKYAAQFGLKVPITDEQEVSMRYNASEVTELKLPTGTHSISTVPSTQQDTAAQVSRRLVCVSAKEGQHLQKVTAQCDTGSDVSCVSTKLADQLIEQGASHLKLDKPLRIASACGQMMEVDRTVKVFVYAAALNNTIVCVEVQCYILNINHEQLLLGKNELVSTGLITINFTNWDDMSQKLHDTYGYTEHTGDCVLFENERAIFKPDASRIHGLKLCTHPQDVVGLDDSSHQSASLCNELPWLNTDPDGYVHSLSIENEEEIQLPAIPDTLPADLRERLRLVLEKNKEVFSQTLPPEGADVPPVKIRLKDDHTYKPSYTPRFNPKLIDDIETQVQRLVDAGIARPSRSEYAAPILLVKKKNNTWRVVINYSNLNDCCESFNFPLPRPLTLVEKLRGKPLFAALDMRDSYYQIPIDEESKKYTAFITPMGLYELNRLPMGYRNSAAEFQRAIQLALKGLEHICAAYQDDIIVFPSSVASLDKCVDLVLTRLREKRFRLRGPKCEIGLTSITYLGYHCDREGVTPTDTYKQGILDLPAPTTTSGCRSLNGTLNFIKPWLRSCAAVAEPITRLCSSRVPFVWGPEQAAAFAKIKDMVRDAPLLHHCDYSKPIWLQTDASLNGIGGFLLQRDENNKPRPLGFFSKTLKGSCLNWGIQQLEMYAIIASLEYFRHILCAYPVTVLTDSRNLLFAHKSKNSRVQRWMNILSDYNVTVKHIPGVENRVPDDLSRVYRLMVPHGDVAIDGPIEPSTPPETNPTADWHNALIGHWGIHRTIQVVKQEHAEWDNYKEDIKRYIDSCPVCQKTRQGLGFIKSSISTLAKQEKFECLAIDAVGPFPPDKDGFRFILQMQCAFTRFVILEPLYFLTASEAAHAIIKVIGQFGIPSSIRSDNSTQFSNALLRALTKTLGIKHQFSVPYVSRTNGGVERSIRESTRLLRAITAERRLTDAWSTCLPLVARAMNATTHSAIGCPPARAFLGPNANLNRRIFPNRQTAVDGEEEGSSTMEDFIQEQYILQEAIIKAAQKHQKEIVNLRLKKWNKKGPPPTFEYGQAVLVRWPSDKAPSKLHPRARGPMIVGNQLTTNVFELQDSLTGEISTHSTKDMLLYDDSRTPDIREVAIWDREEFLVKSITAHRLIKELRLKGITKSKRKTDYEFRVVWTDDYYEPTFEPYLAIKTNAALSDYLKIHPELAKVFGGAM